MYAKLTDFNFHNKKVLVRVDFNVPLDNYSIRDDDLSVEDKVAIHTKTREENAERSRLRYEIDKLVDPENAVNDTKINYMEKE